MAPEEKYTAETKRAILEALEDGEENIALRLKLNIKEDSLERSARRWRVNEADRSHLRTTRGLKPGIKISLVGEELELLERLTVQFPDISLKETMASFIAAGLRCVLLLTRPP